MPLTPLRLPGPAAPSPKAPAPGTTPLATPTITAGQAYAAALPHLASVYYFYPITYKRVDAELSRWRPAGPRSSLEAAHFG